MNLAIPMDWGICPVQSCIMKDAEGKSNLDDGVAYCIKCGNYLLANGILK